MKRLRLLWLPAAALLLSACVQREKEPDHDYGTATLIHPGKVEGHIETASDVDFYRLDVSQDAILNVHLGGIRDVDFVLSIRDKDHQELKRYDETGLGGDEEALDVGVHPGSYYIVVSNKNPDASNPTQAYSMEVELEKPTGHEMEPNETMQTASPLDVPGVTTGHYWPSRNLLAGDTDYLEQDWFRIDVSTGLYLLNIDLSGVSMVDAVMEVYDTNGYMLERIDQGGIGEGESLKDFGVRGPVTYYLRLYSKTGTGNPDQAYEILSELIPYNGKTEFEPNNQRPDATPFTGDSITGTIAPAGDVDWYKISVSGPGKQVLRASVTGVDNMELTLTAADALGNPILTIDNAGRGQPQVLTGLGVTQGDYYLIVAEKTGRRADNRNPYTLSKTITPFEPGLEYELNDTTATANAIKVGSGVDGYIGWKGDVDVYQFNVYQNSDVVFELAGIANVQFVATLLDQDYKEVQTWRAAKPGDSLTFDRSLAAGTYYLKLSAADPSQNNVRDKYSLRLRAR